MHSYDVRCRNAGSTDPKPVGFGFDLFTLSQQWPGSWNKLPACTKGFSIHGLWPDFANGTWPEYCSSSPFDVKQLDPIAGPMACQWPSFGGLGPCTAAALACLTLTLALSTHQPHSHLSIFLHFGVFTIKRKTRALLDVTYSHNLGSNDGFWQHEWDKHGTCCVPSGLFTNEVAYFNRTLSLNRQLDTLGALCKNGACPRKAPYKGSEIISALRSAYNVAAVLACSEWQGSTYLSEVRLCYDLQLGLTDCSDEMVQRSCNTDLAIVLDP
eukprot:gene2973-3543_t